MARKKRKKTKIAGRLLAVLFACALVCFCVYYVTEHLVEEARSRLGGEESAQVGETRAPDAVVAQADPMTQGTPPEAERTPAPPAQAHAEGAGSLRVSGGEAVQLPLSGLLIGIDPGHQEHGNSDQEPVAPGSAETKAKVSTGTQGVATGTPEYAVNLDIALMLRDRLEELGAQVLMTRTTNDVDISNIERAQMCNEAGADIVLRLHCNGATNEQINGIGLYVTETGPIAQSSFEAAELLLPAMARATGAHPAGVFRRDTYSGLNWSTVPSIIVEMGYMSNHEENLRLEDPEYQRLLVDGMARGLARIFARSLDGDK